MKKGIHYWGLPHTMNLREKMEFAKRLGFDGIELVIVEKGELQPDCRKEELMTIRRTAKDRNYFSKQQFKLEMFFYQQ